MSKKRPRVIAICVVRRDDAILVFEGFDPADGRTFYRPLGGGLHWQEPSRTAVAREMLEELGSPVDDLRRLGVLENAFTHGGAEQHEIVFVYEGRLCDRSLYDRERIAAVEANGDPLTVLWMPVDRFGPGGALLVPDGLLELVLRGAP